MSLHFIRKLQDFNTQEGLSKLEQSTNPFAHLVAATLYAQSTRPDSSRREQRKYHLVRNLYRLGLGKEKVRHFFKLIDWVLTLLVPLSQTFKAKIQKLEEENKMPYITSIECLGREEGLRSSIFNVLSARFGVLPESLRKRLKMTKSTDVLNRLTTRAALVESLREFEAELG